MYIILYSRSVCVCMYVCIYIYTYMCISGSHQQRGEDMGDNTGYIQGKIWDAFVNMTTKCPDLLKIIF